MKPVSRNLNMFLRELAQQCPEKKLLGGSSGWLTASDAAKRTEALAGFFYQMGIRSGDLVAVRTLRTVNTALTILALQLLGAVAVLTDPRQEPMAVLRVCDTDIPVKCVLDPEEIGLHNFKRRDVKLPEVDPKAPGFLIFTSGSTGKKKPVMLSQYNLVNNLADSESLGCYSEVDIALGALPMDHVFGLVLLAGVCVLGYALYFSEKTDAPSLLETIQRERITRMNGVPSLYLSMAEHADQYDLASLRAGFIGGGPFTPDQFRRIEEKLSMTLIPVYGMSECVGIACADWRDPQTLRASGSAPFYSMNTGKILLEDGTEAAPGEIGEICVTGPSRMVGYYPDAMPEDMLLPTGDLGYLDEAGRLHLTGRKKDIIIRNGINISPKPIEDALLSIPGVNAACVVGLPHKMQGEVPYALVVGERTPMELFALLPGLLPRNQIPAEIFVTDYIPMTPSGKPDKIAVREVLQKWIP